MFNVIIFFMLLDVFLMTKLVKMKNLARKII